MNRFLFYLLFISVIFLGMAPSVTIAQPEPLPVVFTVNSTTQTNDVIWGDGLCLDSFGKCSLWAALQEAKALGGSSTINLPAGTYISYYNTIDYNLTILGAGASTTIIDGGAINQVFIVTGSLTVKDLTVRNGSAPGGFGGGFQSSGTLNLERVAVTGNTAGAGGGIWNTGSLTIKESLINGNSATDVNSGWCFGGGLYVWSGTSDLTNVTVSTNTANCPGSGLGAGIVLQQGSTNYLKNCTIAYNIGSPSSSGHGIMGNGAPIYDLLNTIVANNTGSDCYQMGSKGWDSGLTSNPAGYNIDSDGSCGFYFPSDRTGINPFLGPLQDNGGPTWTHALLAGSPAIDTGTATNAPAIDQRGISRPQGAGYDIGAFEADIVVTAPTIVKAFLPTTIPLYGTSTLTFTIANSNSIALTGVAFTDSFPAGLQVATPPNTVNNCGGSFIAVAGASSVSLSGGTVESDSNCIISVTVYGAALGEKNNTTGTISSTNGGTGTTSNTATLTVIDRADLAIQKTVQHIQPSLRVGSPLIYNVMVTNLGPTTAPSVNWSDTLPSGLTYVSTNSPALWTCGVSGAGVVSCTKSAAMAVNETAVFTLTVKIACGQADGTQISNTASVSYPGNDPVPANNSSTITVTISNPPTTLTPASASYRSRGGAGSVIVAQSSTCPWTAISDAEFLTITSGSTGAGAGTVNYTFPDNTGSATRTGTLTIAGQTFTVTQTAVAPDNSQTGINLEGVGNGTTSTPGTAPTVETGYAQGLSDTSKTGAFDAALTQVYGTAVFSLTQNNAVVSEAGVPTSVPTTAARLFIDYRPNLQAKSAEVKAGFISINTGVAMVNTGAVTANLVFSLRDGPGATLATGHATLAVGAHRALFIDQLNQWAADFAFPSNFGTAVRYGTLSIASDQAVAVIALRSTLNQRGETLLTTTPIADLTKAPGSGPLYFPQLADGGAFTTTLILMNTSTATETGQIRLFQNDGTGLQVHRAGDASGTASTFSYSIAAGGVYRLETDGAPGTVNVGSVQVVPDAGTTAPVGAGLFRFTPLGHLLSSQTVVTESGVPSATPTTHALVYVDQSNGHMTGVAIAAPNATPVHVTLRALHSDGVTVAGIGSLDLLGNGHDARFVQEFIAGLPTGFTGVLEIMAPTPVVALTLRALTNSRSEFLLTTFPVADFNQPAPGLLFPQIADGGGYQTQIILLNTGPALQYVYILYFGDNGLPLDVAK